MNLEQAKQKIFEQDLQIQDMEDEIHGMRQTTKQSVDAYDDQVKINMELTQEIAMLRLHIEKLQEVIDKLKKGEKEDLKFYPTTFKITSGKH